MTSFAKAWGWSEHERCENCIHAMCCERRKNGTVWCESWQKSKIHERDDTSGNGVTNHE